jgi:hypothetical protein
MDYPEELDTEFGNDDDYDQINFQLNTYDMKNIPYDDEEDLFDYTEWNIELEDNSNLMYEDDQKQLGEKPKEGINCFIDETEESEYSVLDTNNSVEFENEDDINIFNFNFSEKNVMQLKPKEFD